MSTSHPSLSVALCTFNGARHVRDQLESLERQTRRPDEVVICDDGSTDSTVELAREFAATATFPVRVHLNPRRLGSTGNFARALELCHGELIALADQDDVWLPEKLEKSEAALLSRPGALVAFTDAVVVDDQLRTLGYSLWDAANFSAEQRALVRAGRAVEVLTRNQVATGATMLLRAELRELALPIPPTVVHDGWIALLGACAGEIVMVPEPLMLYRQHTSNQIGIRKHGLMDRLRRSRPAGAPAFLTTARDRSALALDRLRQAGLLRPELERLLTGAASHLGARTRMPRSRLRRLPWVARELATKRYFRYSNGLYSAAEDLLRP
jgi:hypothetical protein